MKVSKQSYYGLRAILTLARADKPLSIRALSESEHLPETYLEKILQKLRRAGLVRAEKGAAGGYALARPRDAVSAWDVIRTLDGPVRAFPVPRVKGRLPCLDVSHCQTNEVWRTLEENIEKTLSDITLEYLTRPTTPNR